jgi:DNA-binding transcriptional LysR family regulator
MTISYRRTIPSVTALTAFESAARNGSFTKAAVELSTVQPAVSRHIRNLEKFLGTPLFRRIRNRVILTPAGQQLQRSIAAGFDEISKTIQDISKKIQNKKLIISCSYDIAHLWMLPRYYRLQKALGEVQVHIIALDYIIDASEYEIDISIVFGKVEHEERAIVLSREEAFPVCSPEFLRKHAECLDRHGANSLRELDLLDMRKEGHSTLDWEEWFERLGIPFDSPQSIKHHNNYVYLLEAVCNGEGICLGWRGYVDAHLKNGTLVRPIEQSVTTDRATYLLGHKRDQVSAAAATAIEWLRSSV